MNGRILLSCFLLGGLLAQTSAQSTAPFRVAILGCHRQFEPAPALVRYVESQPDLCLWVGDNIYADTQTDLAHLRACYDAMAAKPAFQQLRKAAPWMATWDDHDFGDNNEWKDYPLKAESKQLFREFWQLETAIPADQAGIYYAEILPIQGQKVQFILLDVRYHRDQPGPTADMLGEAQWQWLGEQFRQEADLRFIISGTQLLLTKESGSETWDEYPQARRRLFDLIEASQAERVIFLTGDQHYGEVCRQPDVLGFDAIELQFAGINQNETPEFNPLRVTPAATALHSYALLDLHLHPSPTEVPHLLFRIYDALSNEVELMYRVNLTELSLKVEFDADTAFIEETWVHLQHPYQQFELRYTTDGSDPSRLSPRYEAPFSLQHSTLVKARLFTPAGVARSRVFAQQYEALQALPAENPKGLQTGVHYEYSAGDFLQLPDFASLSPQESGSIQDFTVSGWPASDHFAVRFVGYLKIPADGLYRFKLASDDGSALYLHDRKVIDNDGSHSARVREGSIALQAGYHSFELQYFEDYDGQSLELWWEGPELALRPLTAQELWHKTKK